MADNKDNKAKVKDDARNTVMHLDRDPNDPRRTPAAKPNLSKLNEEDAEVEPTFQNPVE